MKHRTGDVAHDRWRVLGTEHFFNEGADVSCTHPAFVHVDDRVFQPRFPPLVGLEQLRLELPLAIPGYLQVGNDAVSGFPASTVIAIAAIGHIWMFDL